MRRLAALCLAILLGGTVSFACSPGLAPWILGGDNNVLQGPTAFFSQEVRKLAPAGTVFHEPGEAGDLAERTAAADRGDLEKALQGVPNAQRRAILLRVSILRDAMAPHRNPLVANGYAPAPALLPESLRVPEGLPDEFADYLRGALLYHRQRYPEAAAAWERLLARPEKERRYRSTWAAFMLGKVYLRGDRAKAVEWFQRTRQLARDGFADSLGLAGDSYGWEARAERDRGRLDKALALYVNRERAGDGSAAASIRIVGRAALEAGPDALAAVARDPDAREAMTLFVLSPPYPYDELPESHEEAAAWLAAVKAVGVTKVEAADRMAWAAYLAGDFETAGQWLDKSPDTPQSAWIRAQLLLRDGKLAEARPWLEKAAEVPRSPVYEDFGPLSYGPFATPDRARAEQAVVRLAGQEYVPALDLLATSGYRDEAAYVAELVLNTDELQAYVDKLPKVPPKDWDPAYAPSKPEDVPPALRYLLGRRLAREGRAAEAVPYFPEALRPRVQALASDLKKAGDAKLSAAERARAGFRAACSTRNSGIELVATEAEPDWAALGGAFDRGSLADRRKEQTLFAPSADELARVERHKVQPDRRYHYRYRAADLAWDAAQLLPSGDEKAGVLATAGNWLKNDDPQAADRFYKALVRCCGDTDLGQAADEKRWFPEADTCPE